MKDSLDVWRCSCGEIVMVKPEEYLHIGTPYCADCDKEMTRINGPTYEEVARHFVDGYDMDTLISVAVEALVANYELFPGSFEGDKIDYLDYRDYNDEE